jgi:hypothetical protein
MSLVTNYEMMHAISMFMDAYAIARIIKAIYLYDDSQVIFIYSGNFHKSNYDRYLTEIYQAQSLVNIPRGALGTDKCIYLSDADIGIISQELRMMPQTKCRS